jgi:hypothetical protein
MAGTRVALSQQMITHFSMEKEMLIITLAMVFKV